MDYLKVWLAWLLVVVVFLVLPVGAIYSSVNALLRHQCANNVTEMGREYRYDWVNGCRIGMDDGTFIYWELYRVNQIK